MAKQRITQREVDSAAASLHRMRMEYGEHNLATERAWMRWMDLVEAQKSQKATEAARKASKK